jgi:hypothetical protein
MSRQDIYATIKDDRRGECGHSSSRRGKVENIIVNVENNWNNKRIRLDIDTSGKLKKNDLEYAQERIGHFTKLKNEKKIVFWARRYAEWAIENKSLEESEFVSANINFPLDDKLFKLCVNGKRFTDKDNTILDLLHDKKWKELISFISKNYNNSIDINNEILSNEI